MIAWASRIVLVSVLIVASLPPAPAMARGRRADLSRLVVVGDSLSAGFQNGSLLGVQQVHGYAALIAAQAETSLVLPLIGDPGLPNALELKEPELTVEPKSGAPGVRTNPAVQVTNLAVPAATVEDALTGRPDCDFAPPADAPPLRQIVNVLTDVVLGLPGCFVPSPAGPVRMSQIEWAEALHPTTVIVWLGNNDVLAAALAADASAVTPAAAFKAAYAEALERLAATGAALVVANLPDVTVVPYLTAAEDALELLSARTGVPAGHLAAILGIGPGDYVTPEAFDAAADILAGAAVPPLPGHMVLDAEEVATVRAAIEDFNAFIAAQARARRAALVNVHRILNRAKTHGIVVGGQRLTTEFLGGLFSLDAVHPSNTGYAILANAFIEALNRRFDAGIPRVRLRRVMEQDPLVFPPRP